ncbi:MAG: SRPBCC family protein [Chromatiales bacterium]|nr:SRPBCC family protein [Chromatiales bacterium]
MLRTIGLILIAVITGILAYAAGQPDTFRVERRISISAPPEAIYPLIADFRGWALWSPWEKKDPGMKRTHGGADSGLGAVYEWSGNSAVGAGRMEISQAVPPVKVTIDMRFTRPMEARNTAEFMLAPHGDGTSVTWVMSGPSPFLARLMGLVISMDDMVGGDFESGLAALKAVAESRRP